MEVRVKIGGNEVCKWSGIDALTSISLYTYDSDGVSYEVVFRDGRCWLRRWEDGVLVVSEGTLDVRIP